MTPYEMIQAKIDSIYNRGVKPQMDREAKMNRKITYNSHIKKQFTLEEEDSVPKEIKGYL